MSRSHGPEQLEPRESWRVRPRPSSESPGDDREVTDGGVSGPVLALQRTAGNHAVIRMLAHRSSERAGAEMVQRTIDGYPMTKPGQLETLCAEVTNAGVDVSATTDSERRRRLEQLIQDPTKRWEVWEVIEELSPLSDKPIGDGKAAAPSAGERAGGDTAAAPSLDEKKVLDELTSDVRAVVVWAGSQLPGRAIAQLRSHDIPGLMKKHEGSTEKVAAALADAADMTNFVWSIHQALDQELDTHSNAIRQIVSRLARVGIRPVVFRPADDLLLLPGSHVDPSWVPYADPGQVERLQQLPADQKTLLITLGHGDQSGGTAFSGKTKTGSSIAAELSLDANGKAFMYIPLQCYPQAAVNLWTKQTGKPAASIKNEGKSDDAEMSDWIERRLMPVVSNWLESL